MPIRFGAPTGSGVISMRSLIRGPVATIAIAATNTLAEGNSATVTNGGSSTAASLTFGIPRGAVPAIGFNFNTATTDSDKDAGDIWFDNATPASVTAIYFDNADRDGNTVTTWLDAMDDSTSTINGQLVLTPVATPSAKLVYNVTGSVTDGTGYRKVVVTHVSGTTLPSNDAHIAVEFIRVGDKGETGADAVIPATAFNFNTATTDSDKDAGDIWFNNATPASVTVIYFDNADRDGNTVTSWLDTFDDSTATIKGTITLIPALTPSAKLIYNVTGSVVDGTGYRKVTVTHVAGATLPSDNANIAVSFSRTGNNGVDGSMSGPVSSTDTAFARFNGTDGTTVQDSGVLCDGSNNVSGMATLTLPNTGLHILDTNASHDLIIAPGSDLSADRTLTVTTGDAARTLTISGDATVSQDYSTSGTPQFAGINVGHDTDTTVTRDSAGVIAVEGVALYSNIPQNSQSAAYTAVIGDAQKHIFHPSSDNNARTFTIPANASVAFPIGTAITFINKINTVTIAITSDTLTQAGTGSTGSRTLAANGIATAVKIASTEWIISGTGLS